MEFLRIKTFFLAILELTSRLDFSGTIKPICMPSWASRPFRNWNATIAGWGKQGHPYEYNTKLKEGLVKIWSTEFCSKFMVEKWRYQTWHDVTE